MKRKKRLEMIEIGGKKDREKIEKAIKREL